MIFFYGDLKKEYQQVFKKEVYFLEKVYLDEKGIWGKRLFFINIRDKEELIRRYGESQKREKIELAN